MSTSFEMARVPACFHPPDLQSVPLARSLSPHYLEKVKGKHMRAIKSKMYQASGRGTYVDLSQHICPSSEKTPLSLLPLSNRGDVPIDINTSPTLLVFYAA
jgi:hypothetical protein